MGIVTIPELCSCVLWHDCYERLAYVRCQWFRRSELASVSFSLAYILLYAAPVSLCLYLALLSQSHCEPYIWDAWKCWNPLWYMFVSNIVLSTTEYLVSVEAWQRLYVGHVGGVEWVSWRRCVCLRLNWMGLSLQLLSYPILSRCLSCVLLLCVVFLLCYTSM